MEFLVEDILVVQVGKQVEEVDFSFYSFDDLVASLQTLVLMMRPVVVDILGELVEILVVKVAMEVIFQFELIVDVMIDQVWVDRQNKFVMILVVILMNLIV